MAYPFTAKRYNVALGLDANSPIMAEIDDDGTPQSAALQVSPASESYPVRVFQVYGTQLSLPWGLPYAYLSSDPDAGGGVALNLSDNGGFAINDPYGSVFLVGGDVAASGHVRAKGFETSAVAHGTVGATLPLTWNSGTFHTATTTAATGCTISASTNPQAPCMCWLKIFSPASGALPTLRYTSAFKNNPPTSFTANSRFHLLPFFFDGGSYIYLPGATNVV